MNIIILLSVHEIQHEMQAKERSHLKKTHMQSIKEGLQRRQIQSQYNAVHIQTQALCKLIGWCQAGKEKKLSIGVLLDARLVNIACKVQLPEHLVVQI